MGGGRNKRLRVPVVTPRSRVEVETIAMRFVRAFAPQCLLEPNPLPVLSIFDRTLPAKLLFRPVIDDLGPGFEALTDMGDRTVTLIPAVYDGLEVGGGRSRFTAVHEFGHVALHANELGAGGVKLGNRSEESVAFARRDEIPAYQDPEWQADTFASAALMPVFALVYMEATRGTLSVPLLRDTFRVSNEAASWRLRVFTEHRTALCSIVLPPRKEKGGS